MKNITIIILVSFLICGCSGMQVASHYDGDKYSSGTKVRTNVLSW